jgi:beta-phosphoglucomutase
MTDRSLIQWAGRMEMKMHKGLIFDLDGVIVDTAKYHYKAWKEIADDLNIVFTQEDNERLKGVSRERSFEIILEIGHVSMTKERKEFFCSLKNDIYLSYIRKMTEEEILPGVKDFLIDAKTKGYKIALGSASRNSKLILKNLLLMDYFNKIIDGTSVTSAKPDPEVFVKGASALNVRAEECIVFEDSLAGIEAAHAGGMLAVGIGNRSVLPSADINVNGFADISIENIESLLLLQ